MTKSEARAKIFAALKQANKHADELLQTINTLSNTLRSKIKKAA